MQKIVSPATVGSRVAFYRGAQGLNRVQCAKLIGISATHLVNIEHDLVDIRLSTLKAIAEALGVSQAHLLGELPLLEVFTPNWTEAHRG